MTQLEFLLPLGLVLIMIEAGLGLSPDDFLQLGKARRALGVGLVAQILLLPALALVVGKLFALPASIWIGVMLIAAAPGGVTSTLLTKLAGGQVALAVTLTLLTTLASVLTLPVMIGFTARLAGDTLPGFDVPAAMVARGILATCVTPLLVGMALRAWAGDLADRMALMFRRLAVAAFTTIVLVTFALNVDIFARHGLEVGPALAVLNLAAMASAFGLGALARLQRDQCIAVTFETGLQNAALAVVVAVNVLDQPQLAIPAVIYAVAMNLGAVTALALIRCRGASGASREILG